MKVGESMREETAGVTLREGIIRAGDQGHLFQQDQRVLIDGMTQ